MTSSYPCQKRTSGAGNWQAYIRDSRDSEIYRIVLMPDNKWWLAQNLKYAGTGSSVTTSGCTKDKCGRWYTSAQASGSSGYGQNRQGVCPNGWVLPVAQSYTTLYNSISGTASVVAARLRSLNSPCAGGNDYYGWASSIRLHRTGNVTGGTFDTQYINDNATSPCGAGVDFCGINCSACNNIHVSASEGLCSGFATVARCFRQL
ncbi:MAG: hypothetical protein LBG31_06015 [Prevotellaceae bacterium]|nr:hypothetical protein [Prevotellaceae bacterium]